MAVVPCFAGGGSSTATHGSTCTVYTNDPAAGLVYVNCATSTRSTLGQYTHKQPPGPSDSDYAESVVSTCEGPGGSNTTEQVYYLYAKANPGYKFVRWVAGKDASGTQESTENPYTKTVSHSTPLPNHNPYSCTAIFIAENAVNTSANFPVGVVDLNPVAPQIGSKVTATASVSKLTQNNSIGNKNMMIEFDHWEDENGEILSNKETYEFEVEREMTLNAIFKDLGEVPQKGKYYRVRNVYNRVLSVEGSYTVNIPMTGTDLPDTSLRWALPFDHNYDEFWTSKNNDDWNDYELDSRICVEASPGTIFYVEEGNNNETELNNGVLSSQGINTKTLTNQSLKVQPMDETFYGYYGVVASSASGAGFQAMPRPADAGKNLPARCLVNVSQFKSSSLNCALAIQPIDEDHIDNFWFGAYAESDMAFENGYWTSMYTAFPYQLYDEGVEAYYITATTEANGTAYACLTKIEDRIVPANSAVLLKCNDPENTKTNRMLPLAPAEVSKKLEGNILEGVFQLYTNSSGDGRKLFDESSMRVLGVNSKGEVGFYKIAPSENGGPVELKANKIYLNMNLLPAEAKAISFKLKESNDGAGIESIIEDGSSIKYEDVDVYDLMGRKVANPKAGSLYIVNGNKILWK